MKQDQENSIPESVRAYLSRNGQKGGSSTSEKKAKAVRKNGLVPCRPGKFRGRPKGSTKLQE